MAMKQFSPALKRGANVISVAMQRLRAPTRTSTLHAPVATAITGHDGAAGVAARRIAQVDDAAQCRRAMDVAGQPTIFDRVGFWFLVSRSWNFNFRGNPTLRRSGRTH